MRASRRYPRSGVILSLSALVENLAYALPISCFPNLLQLLGAPIAYIGLFRAVFTTASAVLSQRFGALSDQIGRKPVIALGTPPSWIASLALAFAPNLLAAAGLTVFRSFGRNILMPASRALNADLFPKQIRQTLR